MKRELPMRPLEIKRQNSAIAAQRCCPCRTRLVDRKPRKAANSGEIREQFSELRTGGVRDKDCKKPYGIFLDPSLAPFGKVDGVFSLGVPLTPSVPAAGVPSPVPAWRTKFLSEHQTIQTFQPID